MNTKETWEEEFFAGHNVQNISDPASDTEWVRAFIAAQIEKERTALTNLTLGIYSQYMNNHCQICEGGFTSNKKYMGKPIMSNHGFTRPGDGWLHGSCFGARQNPYEISCDAIKPCIETVKQYRQNQLNVMKRLVEDPPAQLHRSLHVRDEVVFDRPTDFDGKAQAERGGSYGYSDYQGAWQKRYSDASWQVKKADREIARMEKRLADWKPQV